MKKILLWMMALFVGSSIIVNVPAMTARASGESSIDIDALLGDAKEKLSQALSSMDEETVREVFDFLGEKVQDGSLKTEDGLKKAVKEGEDKFGVKVNEADAKKIVETMEKLEELGFSGEYVIEKSKELYDKYGAGFVDHADEMITGAVENAVSNAVGSFFGNLWESAKSFFTNLFS